MTAVYRQRAATAGTPCKFSAYLKATADATHLINLTAFQAVRGPQCSAMPLREP
jgi:hypothetical protein